MERDYFAFLPTVESLQGMPSVQPKPGSFSSYASIPLLLCSGGGRVGKTTLALSLSSEADNLALYLDLELPSVLAKLGPRTRPIGL
jgi:hypothetical protein